jgi:hypothetical protein
MMPPGWVSEESERMHSMDNERAYSVLCPRCREPKGCFCVDVGAGGLWIALFLTLPGFSGLKSFLAQPHAERIEAAK